MGVGCLIEMIGGGDGCVDIDMVHLEVVRNAGISGEFGCEQNKIKKLRSLLFNGRSTHTQTVQDEPGRNHRTKAYQ